MALDVMTASQLIEATREEGQFFDTGTVLDGYPADDGLYPRGNKILPLLNQAIRDLESTGFNVCYFTQPLVANQREYNIYRGMGEVITATLMDVTQTPSLHLPIQRTTISDLDKIYAGRWRAMTGRPLAYYFAGTRFIGLDREPIADDTYSLRFLAYSLPSEMSVAGDIPAQIIDGSGNVVPAWDGLAESALPGEYHYALVYYAAATIKHRSGDHFEGQRLMDSYKSMKERLRGLVVSRNVNGGSKPAISRSGSRFAYADPYRGV